MNTIEEDKNYITSYAFGVDEEFIGKPLAKPSRRFWCIFFDSIIVSILTIMSTAIMAACVCIVSFIGYRKAQADERAGAAPTMLPTIFLVIAGLSIVVFLTAVSVNAVSSRVEGVNWGWSSDDEVKESHADVEDESQVESDQEKQNSNSDKDEGLSIIAWVQAALGDLGLGFGWAALYFSVFTAWFKGQTLGKMLFGIRVLKVNGKPISLWESFGRYGGYSAGLATGLLGFLQVMWDPNRQAIHDKISETVVIDLRKPNRKTSVTP